MAVEVFAAALSAPTAPCAARPSLERGRPLQPLLLNVRVPARGVSSPKPLPSSRQLRRHACRASPRDKSLPGDLGEFDLAQYVEAKVDSGASQYLVVCDGTFVDVCAKIEFGATPRICDLGCRVTLQGVPGCQTRLFRDCKYGWIHQDCMCAPGGLCAPSLGQLHHRQVHTALVCTRQPHMLAHAVKKTADYGHVIYLRLLEERCSSLLPVYIGKWARNAAAAPPACLHAFGAPQGPRTL